MSAIVSTSCGLLAGRQLDHQVMAFLGVPYAAPPIGPLRFAPAQPLAPWDGTRPALDHGPASWQARPSSGRPLIDLSSARQDEDCLSVAVWTPTLDPAARLPVMVWLHGGAFVTGSSSVPTYDGRHLAQRGVVIVNVNYRLGLLGWLRCEALGASGNQGLGDQLAALDWVQREIAAFGGNAENVTLFGESAGAGSIAAHLARGRSLPFHRAILQSGSYNLVNSLDKASDTAARVLGALDGAPASSLLDRTASELADVQDRATPRSGGVFYGPVADGDLVPVEPAKALSAGASASVPVLAGTNRDEMGFFWGRDETMDRVSDEMLATMVARWHRERSEHSEHSENRERGDAATVIETYRRARAARGEPVDARNLAMAIGSDATFRAAVMALARWQDRSHTYRFDWPSPMYGGVVGAAHVLEVPFVFGTYAHPTAAAFTGAGERAEECRALSDEMALAWVAFARDGNPGWAAYTPPARATRVFGGTASLVDDPAAAELSMWQA